MLVSVRATIDAVIESRVCGISREAGSPPSTPRRGQRIDQFGGRPRQSACVNSLKKAGVEHLTPGMAAEPVGQRTALA